MRYATLVLQNTITNSGRWAPKYDLATIQDRLQRELTPQETDALLSQSLWSRPTRHVIGEFQDNYSSDFRLFRIY